MRTNIYTYETGVQELLLCLFGNVPYSSSASASSAAVEIWIPKGYPQMPPMVYVIPPTDGAIQPGNYVDPAGRFYNLFLASWRPVDHTLPGLYSLLQSCFLTEPPITHQIPPQWSPPLPQKLPESTSVDVVQEALSRIKLEAPPLPPLPGKHSPAPTTAPAPISASVPTPQTDLTGDLMSSEIPSSSPSQLKSQIETALTEITTKEVNPLLGANEAKIAQLGQTVAQFELILQFEKNTINSILNDASINESILRARSEEIQQVMAAADAFVEPEVDEIVCAETVVYNQLYKVGAEIKALDDTIAAITKLHDKGTIATGCFVKNVRSLARERYMKSRLADKILETI